MSADFTQARVSRAARWLRPLVGATLGRTLRRPLPPARRRAELEFGGLIGRLIRARGARVSTRFVAGVRCREVVPDRGDSGCCLLYFHGGGYVAGSPKLYESMATRLATLTGARVLIPDYRLAPEHPFPAAVDDVSAVYRALLDTGVEPARVAFAGDSAGGALVLSCALAAHARGLPAPAALVAFSPWTDLAATGDSLQRHAASDVLLSPTQARHFIDCYLGDRDDPGVARTDPRTPLASPLYAAAADLAALPPLLVQAADDEILLDDSTRFADAARAAGASVELQVWTGVWHVWQAMPVLLPEADAALALGAGFLRRHWRLPAPAAAPARRAAAT